MKKTPRNESGFGVIEGLLILIAILLVVFIGYYVWHVQKSTDKNLTSDSTSATVGGSKSNSSKATGSGKFLTIGQWGVKLPLGSDLTGAAYTFKSSSDGQYIDITLPSSECNPMATIVRGKATDIDPTTDPEGDGPNPLTYAASPNAKHVGDYYYSKIDGNGETCYKNETPSTKNPSLGAKTELVYSELDTALSGMVLAN